MSDKKYCFTEEQLFHFLDDYCGCKWGEAGRVSMIKLLEELVRQQKLSIIWTAETDDF